MGTSSDRSLEQSRAFGSTAYGRAINSSGRAISPFDRAINPLYRAIDPSERALNPPNRAIDFEGVLLDPDPIPTAAVGDMGVVFSGGYPRPPASMLAQRGRPGWVRIWPFAL